MLTILKYVFALVPDFIRPQWVCLNAVIWYGEWSLRIILEFVRVDTLKPSGQLYSIFQEWCPYAAKVEAFGRPAFFSLIVLIAQTQKDHSSSGWLESAEPLTPQLSAQTSHCQLYLWFLRRDKSMELLKKRWSCFERVYWSPVWPVKTFCIKTAIVLQIVLLKSLSLLDTTITSELATYMLTMWE